MWGSKKKKDGDEVIPFSTLDRKTGEPVVEEIQDFEYTPVVWKDFITKKKYIREHSAYPLRGSRTNMPSAWHICGIIVTVLSILAAVYHDQIVAFLRPISQDIRNLPAGWLIPIAILIILSFPPLFGHELIALLCGIVYGVGIGFAIVAAGTFVGESTSPLLSLSLHLTLITKHPTNHHYPALVGTWFAFKHLFRRKALKLERTNLMYGALARFTRDGGFAVILLIRFSVVPAHLSTAVFSTCDVVFWHFCLATFLTLPKQLILVYLGVILVDTDTENSAVSTLLLALTMLFTIFAGIWIWWRLSSIKKCLLDEQAARRMDKEASAAPRLDGAWTEHVDADGQDAFDARGRTEARMSKDISDRPRTEWEAGYEGHEPPSPGLTRAKMNTQEFI